jgi:hypothetical protein
MAPKFKLDVKTFLSLKSCVFNNFFFFLIFQKAFNLANFSSFSKKNCLKNTKWPKNSIWQIFYTIVHEFLEAEPLNEMFQFLVMLYFSHFSIVKDLLSVLKVQNGSCIKDGVENIYIFHSIVSKMIFFFFLSTLGKNKTFIMEKLFLGNSK